MGSISLIVKVSRVTQSLYLFQELQEKLITSEWTLDPSDSTPNTIISSLAAMRPLDSIRLCTVYLECLKEWLSNAEGPELVKQLEASREECLLGMAVSFNPKRYYPSQGVDAVVGMGLVFKPAYVCTVSFSSLLMTLCDWSNDPKERLSESCMTFLCISKVKSSHFAGTTLSSWISPRRG